MFFKKNLYGQGDIPVLGLGCMRLPRVSPDKEDIDYKKALEMVDYAYQNGIRYFDTAYPYHGKQSELFVGEALKRYERSSFLLATKMPIWECKNLDDVKRMFDSQLGRLQVEYFDYYLCHAMNIDRHNEYIKYGAYNFLIEMKREGKIKNLGFSYHDVPQNLEIIAKYHNWDFAQLQINYLDWQLQDAKKQYEVLEELKIPCIVMEPVRGGALANVCSEAENLFKGARPNSSIASWALRYVASMKNVMVVLSGMSNMEQLKDNINTFTNFEEINEHESAIIKKAKEAILGSEFIPCTGCKYCMPCPFGVNIARNFRLYNQLQIDQEIEKYEINIKKMPNIELPSNCRSCKVCIKQCPQHINIPQELTKIANKLK